MCVEVILKTLSPLSAEFAEGRTGVACTERAGAMVEESVPSGVEEKDSLEMCTSTYYKPQFETLMYYLISIDLSRCTHLSAWHMGPNSWQTRAKATC